ncbi:MAG: helix-turn-helix transcriptional regulator [Pseudomonadota bacterium]
MLAVVKKPHTNRPILEIKGDIPQWLLKKLKNEYGQNLTIARSEADDDYVNIADTAWYKAINKKMKPGDYIKVYRDNFGMTQAELGRELGNFSRQNISAIENGKRGISKETAKKLSKLFNAPLERFV